MKVQLKIELSLVFHGVTVQDKSKPQPLILLKALKNKQKKVSNETAAQTSGK